MSHRTKWLISNSISVILLAILAVLWLQLDHYDPPTDQLVDIEAVRKLPLSTGERIRRFFEQVADNAVEAGPMHRELLTEMVHTAHEAGNEGEQARQLHDAFGAIVADGLASGDLTRAHSADTLTEMLMGAFYVLMFNWANLDGYPLREQALATAAFLADSMCLDGACPGNGSPERVRVEGVEES